MVEETIILLMLFFCSLHAGKDEATSNQIGFLPIRFGFTVIQLGMIWFAVRSGGERMKTMLV